MTAEMSEFFDFLYGTTDGYVYAPALDRDSGRFTTQMFAWPDAKADLIDYCLSVSAKGLESYVGPALYKTNQSGLKENILGTHVVWTEFDGNSEAAINEIEHPSIAGLPGGLERPQGQDGTGTSDHDPQAPTGSLAPAVSIPGPSLRVQSSQPGHEHVYWRLNELVSDIARIEDINKSISYYYKSDHSGWDANQILRPPGTRNYKRNRRVEILERREESYSLANFDSLPRAKELVRAAIELGDIPTVTDALASSPQWDDKHRGLLLSESIPSGARSEVIMNVAYYAAEMGMEDVQIYAVVDHMCDRTGKFTGRNDRDRRIQDIVNKARTKHPRGLLDLLANPLLRSDIEPSTKTVFGFAEFLKTEVHIEWLFTGLLERNGYGVFSSAPGVGKTTLGINMGLALATGRDFMQFANGVQNPVRVLFLSLEMAHAPIKWFFEHIAKDEYVMDHLDILQENFLIAPVGNVTSLDSEEGRSFLDNLITEHKPATIIIDSLGAVTNHSLTDDVAMRNLFAYLQAVRQRYGISLVFVHHNRKSNGDNSKPIDLSDIFGSVYITAPADFVFTLWPRDEDHIVMRHVKARLSRITKQVTLRRDSNLILTITDESDGSPGTLLLDGTKKDNVDATSLSPFAAGTGLLP